MDQPALFNRYLQLLKEFVALRSISTDPSYIKDIEKTAQWLGNLLTQYGFTVKITKGAGNPIVCAQYNNGSQQHVLIYGHYDVQPAEINEGWTHDPFELKEKNGRLYGRGAVDNKGQIMIYIATVIELIQQKSLGYNVTFLIEGNEEAGSSGLDTFVETHKEKLLADFLLVSDGEITAGHPVIEVGFRGVLNIALTVETSTKDNHSGLYGGIIPNAANELSILLGKLFDQSSGEQRVTIEGFYDNITPPTPRRHNNN
ncbi:MAG: putative succinyl-diaminopimelate desuccinylase, partial [Microgenomates bacterium OLB23]